MSYIKKAKMGKIRRVVNAYKFVSEGLPRVVNKKVNAVTRWAVNKAEQKGLSPKTAAQIRVAIELQAAKDGNQSWRTPQGNKSVTASGVVKPADLEDKYLERLAKIELKKKIQENPEMLDVSSFNTKPKGKIYQLFPKLESIVRSIKEDALPTSARELRDAARIGYDAALKRQKEELAIELSSGDRNPWINRYANARKNIVSKIGEVTKKGAEIVGIGIASNIIVNGKSLPDMFNQEKERFTNYVDTSMKDAKNTMSNINQFATDLPKKIQELQKIPQRASKKSSEAKQYIENKVKESFNRTNQPIKISIQDLKELYDKKASRKGNAMAKRGLKKMHTPMKSVSVPYTRTLTDDSVPSPKKFVHKMMGGKTGRMGKELTGADGVKGRYFQKGQRMIKFYEVDKPHAPQMRSMGMGMSKMQKGMYAPMPMVKRVTRKMHEITDENYYGNQKPRKKDEFRKNQGAFVNGRKLKY